jgi:hypothetical protein
VCVRVVVWVGERGRCFGILNPTLPIPAYTPYIQVTDCRYFEGPRLRGNSKARQQAELAFDRKRKRYLVFENFSPHRLRLKNSVILLKNLVSFCLREPEELNRFLELESQATQEILEDRPRMFYDYDLLSSPPMSPGCCRCLKDFILHIENGQYLFFFFDDYCFVCERERRCLLSISFCCRWDRGVARLSCACTGIIVCWRRRSWGGAVWSCHAYRCSIFTASITGEMRSSTHTEHARTHARTHTDAHTHMGERAHHMPHPATY